MVLELPSATTFVPCPRSTATRPSSSIRPTPRGTHPSPPRRTWAAVVRQRPASRAKRTRPTPRRPIPDPRLSRRPGDRTDHRNRTKHQDHGWLRVPLPCHHGEPEAPPAMIPAESRSRAPTRSAAESLPARWSPGFSVGSPTRSLPDQRTGSLPDRRSRSGRSWS